MNTMDSYDDEGSRLAAATQRAIKHRHRLTARGHSVSTAEREAAETAVNAARAAEIVFWQREGEITALLDILDIANAHIDFEPGYRIIYGYFTKISEARAALLAVRAAAPAATMTVDGTKATITIAMGDAE